ncbi:MAG: GNAT family N-acetyltransferase [Arcobacteraceae bacterium]
MNTIFIKNQNNKYFEKAWQIYEESFPQEEKRTLAEQIKLFDKKSFTMLCYIEDEKVLAILFYWQIERYTYLEHFAVNSTLRGRSYGSKILQEFIDNNQNIILEIEPIIDEATQKRLDFYERFDFRVNNHIHFQVPFRKNSEKLQLIFLSHKKVLSDGEYTALYQMMLKVISYE